MEEVGIVLGLKNYPSTPFEVWVGIYNDKLVQLEDVLVISSEVANQEVKYYGIVSEVKRYEEGIDEVSQSFLTKTGRISSIDTLIAKVNITRIEPEILISPKPTSPVYRPSFKDKEIEVALFYDQMGDRIPAGISHNRQYPIYINYHFINGKEGAHVSISGMSGVATKTSYALFLLYSIFSKGRDRDKRALIFNVKGKDLMWIDKRNKNFKEKHRRDFELLGLEPKPFEGVSFYSPPEKVGSNYPSFSAREGVNIFKWSIRDFAREELIYFMFNYEELNSSNLMHVLEKVAERLKNLEGESDSSPFLVLDNAKTVSNLRELYWEIKRVAEGKDPDRYELWFGKAQRTTVNAFLRRFEFAIKHCQNLVWGEESKTISWSNSKISVVDISELRDVAKSFVVGAILRKVFEEKERMADPKIKLFVLLDELNKYAPRERNSPIKDILLDIAERGRSLGVILIGAQQNASEVEKRIYTNASIKVLGRIDSAEVSSKEYDYLDNNYKKRAIILKKGTMILLQPDIPTPISLNFPYPPWATRREEVEESLEVPKDFNHFNYLT